MGTQNKPAHAPCLHCNDTGHTDHDADVPCAVCKPAPAPLPICCDPTANVVPCCVCGKPVHTCEARNASGENNHCCPAHPGGSEREDGTWVCSEGCDNSAAAIALMRREGFDDDADVLVSHITDLTRRLAEVEAGNGRFADMLESSVADWRKLYAEERAERVRIQHILMDDVRSERQESDEHIKGLNTIIATQDKNIGDLKAHIQRIEVDHDDVEARAVAAEAQRDAAQATVKRIVEDLRGTCECCVNRMRGNGSLCVDCRDDADVKRHWTPPRAWGLAND